MLVIILMVIVFFFLLLWRLDEDTKKTFGSASWCRVWSLFRRGLFYPEGVRVGDWKGRTSIFYNDTHAISFGSAGCGKGTTAILPNLLEAEWAFVVDPGGENTAIAAKSYRQRGLYFGCINPFGLFAEEPWALPAHGFNPLDFLDPDSHTFAADALVFAEMLTPRSGEESGSSSYFKDAAARVKRALLIHIKTAEPKAQQSLATLYGYISGDAESWEALLSAMKANPVCGGLVLQEANTLERIETQATEEFSAIMSTIQQDLSWLADPLVRAKMSRSDVDFSQIKGMDAMQAGAIISVILPLEYIESHAAITRLALACAVLEIQRTPIARNKILFLIDEAAALGKILRFPSWLATLRKYNINIWSIWQTVGQVKTLYQKNWQTVIGNCGLIQFLGIGDPETGEYLEKLLGKCTVGTVTSNSKGERNFGETGRCLLTSDELRRLAGGLQIVFIGNLPPILLRKTPYWQRPELEGLYEDNPYRKEPSPQPDFWDRLAEWQGDVYLILVWLMAPHRHAAWLMTGLFIISLLWIMGGS